MDLGNFYEKYSSFYYRYLSRKLCRAGLSYHAEDIIHDVVVALIADEKRRKEFERFSERQAKAYFMTCLLHRTVDIWRREKRGREYLERVERLAAEQELMVRSVEQIVLEQMTPREMLSGLLCTLSREEQELLNFVFLQNLPYREIAKRGKLKESAIAMRVFRLRKKIRKICGQRQNPVTVCTAWDQ